MFDNTNILSCLNGFMGFRQPADPCLEVSTSLTASTSGVYFDDLHPLASLENLKVVAPNFGQLNAKVQVWDIAQAYLIGDKVQHNGNKYVALQNSTGQQPDLNPLDWQDKGALQTFDDWAGVFVEAQYLKALNRLFEDKTLREVSKTLLTARPLLSGIGRFTDTEIPKSRFVGLEFTLDGGFSNIKTIINKLGVQFNTSNPFTLTLYLYHSSQVEALQTFELTVGGTLSYQWQAVEEFDMFFGQDDIAPDGAFYLGYYEDDLPQGAQAINRIWEYAKPCYECNRQNFDTYKVLNQFVEIRAVSFPFSSLDGVNMPDIGQASFYPNINFGLNMYFSVYCDITDLLCRNKSVLSRYLGLGVALGVVQEIANSIRINPDKSQLFRLAITELDTREHKESIKLELEQAFEALSFDLSSLDPICLPCNESNGITLKIV